MRTYARTLDANNNRSWVVIETDPDGFDDAIWLTTLIQCLLLNLGESPFYANHGIPAKPSIVQQVFPDFYVVRTQQQFAQYFASLIISKVQSPDPTYNVNVVTQQGVRIEDDIPVPLSNLSQRPFYG